jgi:hypothetical protein
MRVPEWVGKLIGWLPEAASIVGAVLAWWAWRKAQGERRAAQAAAQRVQQHERAADLHRLSSAAQVLLAALDAEDSLGPRYLAAQIYAGTKAACARYGSRAPSPVAEALLGARRYAGDLLKALATMDSLDDPSRSSLRTACVALLGELATAVGGSHGAVDAAETGGSP